MILLTPGALGRAPAGAAWAYLGVRAAGRLRAEERLGASTRRSIGRELTAVARDLRRPYLDWLESLGRAQADRLSWWASTLAARSPLQSDFFLLVCYAELARRWSRGGGPDVVVVEDPWLAEQLGVPASWARRLDEARCLALAPVALAATLAQAATAMLLSRLLRLGETEAPAGAVLLFTWLERRSFGREGGLEDPYTGRLAPLLESGGARVVRLVHWHADLRLLARLRGLRGVLVPARFLRLSDLAAGMRLFRPRLAAAAPLAGLDVSRLLARELRREWAHAAFSRHLVGYRAFARLARRAGKAASVIYPYENHAWEKTLCLAWREAGAKGRLVGHQHTTVPSLLLNYFLGSSEAEISPLPDVIVATGERNRRLLEAGLSIPVVDGGALRYEAFAR